MEIKKIFGRFYEELSERHGRSRAWDHCYSYFGTDKLEVEKAYLHLTAFLAVFGMYRGAGKLSKKDYLVNKGAVEIILNYKQLRQFPTAEQKEEFIQKTITLKEKLSAYYKSEGISSTDTLISKVMFGTLGCTPAYDTYFLLGVKDLDHQIKFDETGLKSLYKFYNDYKKDFEFVKKEIELKTKVEYPPMKLIDLYFWLIGDEKIRNKNRKH